MHSAVSTARAIADRLPTVESGRGFDRAVADFADVLRGVPNQGVAEFLAADHEALKALADRVIGRIEARLAAHRDRAAIEQDLAGSIYRIRRELEEIDRWRRHYHGAARPAPGRTS